MAKTKGKKKPTKKVEDDYNRDLLVPALATFDHGAYPDARTQLKARADDPEASSSERKMAQRLIDATRLEKGTLWVALACVGLYLLVIFVSSLKQA